MMRATSSTTTGCGIASAACPYTMEPLAGWKLSIAGPRQGEPHALRFVTSIKKDCLSQMVVPGESYLRRTVTA